MQHLSHQESYQSGQTRRVDSEWITNLDMIIFIEPHRMEFLLLTSWKSSQVNLTAGRPTSDSIRNLEID